MKHGLTSLCRWHSATVIKDLADPDGGATGNHGPAGRATGSVHRAGLACVRCPLDEGRT